MDKRLYVKEGNLEIIGKRLDITMLVDQHKSNYSFPRTGLSRVVVEEWENGNSRSISVGYLHYLRLVLAPTSPHDTKNQQCYFQESRFAEKLDDLFLRLIHGEKYLELLPPEEQRPIYVEDLAKFFKQKRTFLDQEKHKPESPLFKGELCQAIESYLRNKTLPEGMALHKIEPWLNEPEDPFAYSLHIDLSK